MDEEGLGSSERGKSVRLDEKGKEKKLKERLAARKKAKRGDRLGTTEETEQVSATPGDDSTSPT